MLHYKNARKTPIKRHLTTSILRENMLHFVHNTLMNSDNRPRLSPFVQEKSARVLIYPIVLNRTLAFTNANARIELIGISLGEWWGL